MRKLASWFTIAALAVLSFAPWVTSCNPPPAEAAIRKPSLSLLAQGDTLHIRTNWRNVGTFDSVIIVYTGTLNSGGAAFTAIRKAVAFPKQADTTIAIPAPPLTPGSVVTVLATLAIKIGVNVIPSGQLQAGYTQPGILPDSLRVSQLDIRPKAIQVAAGQTVQFCVFGRYANGQAFRSDKSLGPECDLAFAAYLTEQPS